jgi:ribosomal protein S18 acetylase RimI-like enzyme
MSDIRPIAMADLPALIEFSNGLPEGDRTFFKEEVDDDVMRRWCGGRDGAHRWILFEDDVIKGFLAIIPLPAWSSHVGELRLVVGAQHRRQGIGQRLARHGLVEGVRLGLGKLVVEVVADREGDIALFSRIGFRPEALLEDQIRDRDGHVRDLVILAHHIDENAGAMDAVGLDDAVGATGPA